MRSLLRDRNLLAVAGIWALLCAGTELAAFYGVLPGFPFLASKEGGDSDYAIFILVCYAGANFFFIGVPLVYAALRWRRRNDDQTPARDQRRSHPLFPWFWLSYASTMAVTAIIFPGVVGLLHIWKPFFKQPALTVNVTAQQWEWHFAYPQYGIKDTDTLALPVDARTKFHIVSLDVVHSFWVPAFRIKFDAVPGEGRDLYLTPDKIASTADSPLLRVQCAELCGVGHSDMQATVEVMPRAQFMAWVHKQQAKKEKPKLPPAVAKKLKQLKQQATEHANGP